MVSHFNGGGGDLCGSGFTKDLRQAWSLLELISADMTIYAAKILQV